MSKRILLADNSTAAIKSVEQILGTADYQISNAADGRSALKQINDKHPHLVLVHAMLPEVDGYEVCRQVKDAAETAHIPVLLLTGTFEPFDINQAKEVRYDGFVTKPLDSAELLALVKRCIDNAVYPAVVEPEPVALPEAEPEVIEAAPEEDADVSAEPVLTTGGIGSDAMLDRIFPDEPGASISEDTETVEVTTDAGEELFSIVETSEADQAESTGNGEPASAPSTFGIWGERKETEVEQSPPAEEPDPVVTTEDTPPADTTVAAEDSDLSWFLRKYEEKQETSADDDKTPDESIEPPAPEKESSSDVTESDPEPLTVEPLPAIPETTETVAIPVTAPSGELDDLQVERIARRVVELLSDRVVRDVAWEAVPEIAERLVRERISEIEAQTDTSD